ncbi:general odorant-binding protein 72-like [Contarinia nasturtii]|uniref:general odorant-binding protein 72-like n=1 Tax=Contarinia nasturtii TaxID=265458 RepID=UPI0012D4C38F|nr:general odorant-binding protein 72-like [Contarinia nasturtii]
MKSILILTLLLSCFNGIYSNLTLDELMDLMKAFRQQCETKSNVDEELVDGINLGKFPKDPALMCYTHCILESLNMIRKGKLKADLAIKNVNTFLPANMREQWVRGITACKEIGDEITEPCERTFAKVECFYSNNDHFLFP